MPTKVRRLSDLPCRELTSDITPDKTPLILRAIHLADEHVRPDAGRELVVECLRHALRLYAAAREQPTIPTRAVAERVDEILNARTDGDVAYRLSRYADELHAARRHERGEQDPETVPTP